MSKVLTTEYVSDYLNKFNYKLLNNYTNALIKIKVECPNNHNYEVTFHSFKNGTRCSECHGNKKLTYKFVKDQFEKEGYILLSKKYKNTTQKLKYVCPEGHIALIVYGSFQQGHRCNQCNLLTNFGKTSNMWKGGVSKLNLPLYDTYACQISWVEKVRRDPNNSNLLQIKCTEINCRKWYTPTRQQVYNRIEALKKDSSIENRFYCSDKCKNNCVIFKTRKYPKTFKIDYYREVQPELRNLVLQRDKFECQKCEDTNNLQCHHFEGIKQNPIESADIDNCITLCKKCHKEAHKDMGCRYSDLTCKGE